MPPRLADEEGLIARTDARRCFFSARDEAFAVF